MNLDKFCNSLGITSEVYIAVLEEEHRISTSSSLLLTRAQRIYDLKEREKHKPIIRKISNDDMDDPYGG